MEYRSNVTDPVPVYAFEGRWTFKDHAKAVEIAGELNDMNADRCVFDLSGVEFMDSAALGMLLLINKTAEARKTTIELRGAKGQLYDLFKLARMDKVFDLA